MPTAELIVELPVEELDFLKAYAEEHGTTVAVLLKRYAQALRHSPRRLPHPANVQFTGTVPTDVDARDVYRQHIIEKHQ
jgi:hypothetical protein